MTVFGRLPLTQVLLFLQFNNNDSLSSKSKSAVLDCFVLNIIKLNCKVSLQEPGKQF